MSIHALQHPKSAHRNPLNSPLLSARSHVVMSTLRHARKEAVVLNGRSGIPNDRALGLKKAGWSTAKSSHFAKSRCIPRGSRFPSAPGGA